MFMVTGVKLAAVLCTNYKSCILAFSICLLQKTFTLLN